LGEKIKFPSDITKSEVDAYLKNLNALDNGKSLRLESKVDWSLIPLETTHEMIKTSMKNYPDLTKEEYQEEDIAKFKKVISEIKNNEDIKNKKSTLFEYYNLLVIKDIEKLAKEFLKKGKLANDNNACRVLAASQDPIGANIVLLAAAHASNCTKTVYNTNNIDANDFVNAFRHSFWNAWGVRQLCVASLNKWRSLDRMKKFASAHECYNQLIFNAMDLNNNLVGRTYMYETVGQNWYGAANNIPSQETIITKIKNFSNNPKTTIDEIMAMSVSYNWASLGYVENCMGYHTPTSGKLVTLP
jgi:hypothetical protein